MLKRLHRLLFIEIISLALVIMAALTTVMFLIKLLGVSEYLLASQEGILSLFLFIVFLFPELIKMTLPLSFLLATAIVFVRLSQDRELEAWMSFGVGVTRLAVAPFCIGIMTMIMSLGCSLYLEPMARQEFRKFRYMQTRRSVESVIENKVRPKTFHSELFSTSGTDISFYVDDIVSNQNDFKGIFIALKTERDRFSSVIMAESGSLRKEDTSGFFDFVFTLRNGRIYQPVVSSGGLLELATEFPQKYKIVTSAEAKQPLSPEILSQLKAIPVVDWKIVDFGEMRVSLVNLFSRQFEQGEFSKDDVRSLQPKAYIQALRKIRKQPDWQKVQRNIRDHTYFYEKIIVPLSCLFLPIIGLCLGIHDPRRKAGGSYLGVGLVVFLFYASVMLSTQLAVKHFTPPEATLFLPPVVLMCVTATVLVMRSKYPPSVQIFEFFKLELLRLSVLVKTLGRRPK